ncbi:apolipoprotein C-II isoform 1-T2 [Synchiropus picturatus]
MNKLLVITVLVTLLAINAESFRLVRQAEEEVPGPLTRLTNAFKSTYSNAVDTVSGYVESIKELKLEEKAKNFYTDTTTVLGTYAGIFQDQIYHIVYAQQ